MRRPLQQVAAIHSASFVPGVPSRAGAAEPNAHVADASLIEMQPHICCRNTVKLFGGQFVSSRCSGLSPGGLDEISGDT